MFRKIAATRIISTISTLFLLIFLMLSLSAQDKSAGEKVLIGGKTYLLYTAVSGDTSYSLARKFGITLTELINSNPEIKDQLNSGQTLRIPVAENRTTPPTPNGLIKEDSEDGLFIYHSVRKKETVFSIAQKSNITSEDIYQHNPQAREGLKEGEVLKIPKPVTFSKEIKAPIKETQQPIKHIVKRRETLFSIARQYNTTQEEILKSNPTLKGNLKKGTILLISSIPVLPAVQEIQKELTKTTEYQIVSGDNYFQLEKRFGISETELTKLNPALKDGFKTGMIIKIPVKGPAIEKKSQFVDSLKSFPVDLHPDLNKTFEVGVFLPFCQSLNDSTKIVQRTASFLEFYSGVLLATEKISEAGMKVKLYTYDTYQNSKIVEKLVKNPEFLSLDLIIGPVYPANQKIVAELSAKNRIPMISPLSSDSRFVAVTPGYYQINPGKKLRLSATADYIAREFADQNIIVLNRGSNSGDIKVIIDRLNQKLGEGKFRQYNILAAGTTGLKEMLIDNKENIIVLAESSEANVSVAMTRLNTISKSNKITVIGLQEYTKLQSIDIENLHNIRLHYLSPYFIDYGNPKVNAFIQNYRSAFGSEPTQYSFQGYDIALHFMATLAMAGKNFPAINPSPGVDLLQADYKFQKPTQFGGYMNKTLYIIEYTDSFEVRSAGKILGEINMDIADENDKNGL